MRNYCKRSVKPDWCVLPDIGQNERVGGSGGARTICSQELIQATNAPLLSALD
jgi:hypothetical protein